MSNSDHFFLLKKNNNKHHHQIQFNLLPIPDLPFQDPILLPRHRITAQQQDHQILNPIILQDKQQIKDEEESTRQLSLGELKATEDIEEDGFKTPDSFDRKIPAMTQCPGAPRKPRAVAPKRKASEEEGNNVRRSLQFDLTEEVESLFPRVILADYFHKKMKKSSN